MQYPAPSSTNSWRLVSRLLFTTLSQYLLIVVVGTLLWIPLAVSFPDSSAEQPGLAESMDALLTDMAFQFAMALDFSWPVASILLLTLAVLYNYGQSWRPWQRWFLLLTGITLSAFLPVPYVRAAWSELFEVSLGWAFEVCRPWILAAYLVMPWANRNYLRSAASSA